MNRKFEELSIHKGPPGRTQTEKRKNAGQPDMKTGRKGDWKHADL